MAHESTKSLSKRGQYWLKQVQQWEGTSDTQAAFCRRYGLSAVAFNWWKRQLVRRGLVSNGMKRPGTPMASPSTTFVELSPVSNSIESQRHQYEITLNQSKQLRIHQGFNPQEVAVLVSVLEQSC